MYVYLIIYINSLSSPKRQNKWETTQDRVIPQMNKTNKVKNESIFIL